MSQEVDMEEVKIAILIVLVSGLSAYFFQPLIHGNQDAINVIVTVFSILAGFLVAVITLVGDPMTLPIGSWQVAELGSKNTRNRLIRYKLLFILYLSTLALIFISMLLKSYPEFQYYIEIIYMFIASAAFIISFRLPSALMNLQEKRIEQEIEGRREKENISKIPDE